MAARGLPTQPRDTEALPEGPRLLLDALRAWADPGSAGPLGAAALVLAAAGTEAAALPLDTGLRELAGLTPRPRLCPRLGVEEARFLAAVAALQAGQRPLALALLQGLAPPLGAHRALPSLCLMACALRRGGVALGR